MKNLVLIFLILLNLVLVTVVVHRLMDNKPAYAQPMGLSGNYIMVSGAILGKGADAIYIIDLEKRRLHALYYDRASREVSYHGSRDLSQDLSGESRRSRRSRR